MQISISEIVKLVPFKHRSTIELLAPDWSSKFSEDLLTVLKENIRTISLLKKEEILALLALIEKDCFLSGEKLKSGQISTFFRGKALPPRLDSGWMETLLQEIKDTIDLFNDEKLLPKPKPEVALPVQRQDSKSILEARKLEEENKIKAKYLELIEESLEWMKTTNTEQHYIDVAERAKEVFIKNGTVFDNVNAPCAVGHLEDGSNEKTLGLNKNDIDFYIINKDKVSVKIFFSSLLVKEGAHLCDESFDVLTKEIDKAEKEFFTLVNKEEIDKIKGLKDFDLNESLLNMDNLDAAAEASKKVLATTIHAEFCGYKIFYEYLYSKLKVHVRSLQLRNIGISKKNHKNIKDTLLASINSALDLVKDGKADEYKTKNELVDIFLNNAPGLNLFHLRVAFKILLHQALEKSTQDQDIDIKDITSKFFNFLFDPKYYESRVKV